MHRVYRSSSTISKGTTEGDGSFHKQMQTSSTYAASGRRSRLSTAQWLFLGRVSVNCAVGGGVTVGVLSDRASCARLPEAWCHLFVVVFPSRSTRQILERNRVFLFFRTIYTSINCTSNFDLFRPRTLYCWQSSRTKSRPPYLLVQQQQRYCTINVGLLHCRLSVLVQVQSTEYSNMIPGLFDTIG